MNEIMTPDHPLWNEFIDKLDEELSYDGSNHCSGDESKPVATKILQSMPNINVEESLRYFDEHGGGCDCEIIFNVDPD